MVTNSEKANILRAKEALRKIISGKCQLFDMLPKSLRCGLVITLEEVKTGLWKGNMKA